jgi:hypothetical protein
MSPYEYHNDILGVQARYLFEGRDAAEGSLNVIGDRGLRKRIEKEEIVRLRYNGPNTPMLVRWDSIPYVWQNMLIEVFGEPQKQVRQTLFEKNYKRDTAAYYFYLRYQKTNSQYLSDEIIEEYTLNASVLNLIRLLNDKRKEFRKALRGSTSDVWETIAAESTRFKKTHPHTLPENSRRLREKLNQYNKHSYESLIHKGVCNSNAVKVDDDMISFFNNLFATQADKPTATEVARQYDGFLDGYVTVINNVTGEEYNPKEFTKLSQSSILTYLAQWRNQIGNHAERSGDRQILMGKFKPYHSLEQPKMAGSIISIDDRNPPFEYAKGKRVWFYNGIDLGSEAFTCWVHGTTKDGIIIDFYRQMIRNYTGWGLNIPAEIECESSLNSSFRNTFLREGAMFEYVRIEANNARGKRIEAYYRPLRYGLEKKREGWLARPFALSESNQTGSQQVPPVPYNEIIEGCLRDIETWNNMPHSKIKDKSRWEVFLAMQNPDVKPTNWRAILPQLGYCTKTSCHAGIIKLQNSEFLLGLNCQISYSDELIRLMDLVEGRNITTYWLDGNDNKVLKALVYIGDQFICEAIAKPEYNRARIERTGDDLVQREAMSKYVATIEGYMKDRKRAIDQVTVIDNRVLTIGNKFQMPGLKPRNFEPSTSPEILPEIPEDEFELITVEASFKPSLKDRF